MSPGRGAGEGEASTATARPVIWAHSAVVSSSDRLHSRPPPTLTVTPDQWSGSSSWALDQRDEILDVQQVADLPSAPAVADRAQRLAEAVGEHPVGGGGSSAHDRDATARAVQVSIFHARRFHTRPAYGRRTTRGRAGGGGRPCARESRRCVSPREPTTPSAPPWSWSARAPARRARPSRVAVAQGIPLSFLENILNQLKSAGVVRSQRGPEGGWWLLRAPDELTVADVIRAVEGPLASVRGERPEHLAYDGSAESLQDVWIALRANIRGVLEHVTLADIAEGKLPREIVTLARSPAAWASG